jgi:hypothetical protein
MANLSNGPVNPARMRNNQLDKLAGISKSAIREQMSNDVNPQDIIKNQRNLAKMTVGQICNAANNLKTLQDAGMGATLQANAEVRQIAELANKLSSTRASLLKSGDQGIAAAQAVDNLTKAVKPLESSLVSNPMAQQQFRSALMETVKAFNKLS